MPSTDPCQERRLEQERQKREKYLHQKVQETLSLAVPEQPIAEKVLPTCNNVSSLIPTLQHFPNHLPQDNNFFAFSCPSSVG